MASKTKDQIKAFFITGAKPTESQFIDFIDSYVDKSGPVGAIETAASSMGTGFAAVSGGNGELWNAAKALGFMGIMVYTTAQVSAVAVDATRNAFVTTAQASAAASDAIVSAYATTAQANTGTAEKGIMSPVLTKNAIQTLGGKVIQRAYSEYTDNANLSTVIPYDDTIPQITEGTEVLTATITPRSNTNRIRVRFKGFGAVSLGNVSIISALFIDTTGDALAVEAVTPFSNLEPVPLSFEYEHVPGDVLAHTYRVRIGPESAANVRLNGTSSARLFGGISKATLIVEEIQV